MYTAAPPLRNRTIRSVAENTAMQVEMELFERGVMGNHEFYVLVHQWEKTYAAASQYLEAERLRAAIQRIHHRQPLPPIGPPLIAADVFPTVAGATPATAAPVHMPARSNQPASSQRPTSSSFGVSSSLDTTPREADITLARGASVDMPARINRPASSQRPSNSSPRVGSRVDTVSTVGVASPETAAPVSTPAKTAARNNETSAAASELAQLTLEGSSKGNRQPRSAHRGGRPPRRGTGSNQNV